LDEPATPPSPSSSNNDRPFPNSLRAPPALPWPNPSHRSPALARRRRKPGPPQPRNSGFNISRRCAEPPRLGAGHSLQRLLPRLRAVSVRRVVGHSRTTTGPRRGAHRSASCASAHRGGKAVDPEPSAPTLQPPLRLLPARFPSSPSTCLRLLPRRGRRRHPPQPRSGAKRPRAVVATCKRTLMRLPSQI
jgi:hypothetical protein